MAVARSRLDTRWLAGMWEAAANRRRRVIPPMFATPAGEQHWNGIAPGL